MEASRTSRRRFLGKVGTGMLVAGLGYSASRDLGLAVAWEGSDPADRLSFGPHERLVALLQETPADRLLPKLVDMVTHGTDLRDLVAAAALANARGFGGEDYIGFHTFMALMPAYQMAQLLPSDRRALPVLKVLYRNAARLHEAGHATEDTLRPVTPDSSLELAQGADVIRESIHRRDAGEAERALAAVAAASPDGAWNDLLPSVQEAPEVHRIVLAHRAWDMLNLVGSEHAATLLRQSVRYCIRAEEGRLKSHAEVVPMLTRLMDQHKLANQQPGTRQADDAWIAGMMKTLFTANREQAADAVAAALAEGFSLDSVSEAICLTANQLVLCDAGRPPKWAQPGKPVGSVHGDSVGVHASDATNAWRHVASVSNPRNAMASLILSGWNVARDREYGGNFQEWQPRPLAEHLEQVKTNEPTELLAAVDDAIRAKAQDQVCAVTHRYLELGHSAQPVFDMLLRYSTSEDGSLHAEKYFWTVRDEYSRTRAAFRNRQLVALARVAASEYGTKAAGYEEACRLLGVTS